MNRTVLIGGGREPELGVACHRPFVAAAGGPIVCLAVDAGEGVDEDRWRANLTLAGAEQVRVVVLSSERPFQADDVAGASGVYVCGGLTPLYAELLAPGDWLPAGVAYGGFSAGAAIAAGRAIVGGWRIGELAVCDESAGEDLDQVEVVDGLRLVGFSVDVHATQWGTLTRLLHSVRLGLVEDGWAIDEYTSLSVVNDELTVHGAGSAYHVWREGDGVRVAVGTGRRG